MAVCTDCHETHASVSQCSDLCYRCSVCRDYREHPETAHADYADDRSSVPAPIVRLLALDVPKWETDGLVNERLTCSGCGVSFFYYVGEQLVADALSLLPPSHCPACRNRQAVTAMPVTPESADPNIIDITAEYRQSVAKRVKLADDLRGDLLRELALILRADLRPPEKAVRIRNVMQAFEVDEDALPHDAYQMLKIGERMRLNG